MGTVVNIPAARMFFAPAVSMACFASSSPNQWRRSNHLGLKAGPARHHYRDAGSRHDRVRPEVRRLKVRCGSWAPMSRGPANGGYGVEPRRPFTAAGMTGFGAQPTASVTNSNRRCAVSADLRTRYQTLDFDH